jgi:hypothetical protein
MKKFLIISIIAVLSLPLSASAALIDHVRGRILLQVEEFGEAWYVNPDNDSRYYMGRPDDAFDLMRNFGLGATNENLNLIPIGYLPLSGKDSDNDGLSDDFEISQGTATVSDDTDGDGYDDLEEITHGYSPLNPLPKKLTYDQDLINSVKGKILLQVEGLGEAWYVYPDDGKRYFLGRPADAFNIMRQLGLGITNDNLYQINYEMIMSTYEHSSYSIDYPQGWPIEDPAQIAKSDRSELEQAFYKVGYNDLDYTQFTGDIGFIRVAVVTQGTAEDWLAKFTENGIKFLAEDVKVSGYDAIQAGGLFPDYNNTRIITTIIKVRNNKMVIVLMTTSNEQLEQMQEIYDSVLNTFENKN